MFIRVKKNITKEEVNKVMQEIENSRPAIITSLPDDNIEYFVNKKLLEAVNQASPYLSFEQLKDGTWEWAYNCVVSEEQEDNPLLTLEDCIASYVKWSAKELEPIDDSYE